MGVFFVSTGHSDCFRLFFVVMLYEAIHNLESLGAAGFPLADLRALGAVH